LLGLGIALRKMCRDRIQIFLGLLDVETGFETSDD
jgi:hypothetical protein